MATSSPMKPTVQDPLYHYETHFPEKAAHLQPNPEYPQPFNKRRKQRVRSGYRYKTQPVTFDEIQEVDEEGVEENKKDGLKNQFEQFSRSMDGKLPGAYTRPKPTKVKAHKPTLPVPTEIPRAEERLSGASSKETSPMPSPGVESLTNTTPPFPAVNTPQNLPLATNETDYRQGRAAKVREARKARRAKLMRDDRAESSDT